MAFTLKDLIISSGNTGASGQSFKNHVTGAVSGAKLSDYKLQGLTHSNPPVPDAGTYASSVLINNTVTFTRGSRFHHIQRNVTGAWQYTVTSSAGSGATVENETFSAGGSPTGATHDLGIRMKGAYVNVSLSGTASADQVGTPPADLVPWAVQFTANISGTGDTGSTTLDIEAKYDPNVGNFNADVVTNWNGIPITNRQLNPDTDFDYEWRSATAGGGTLLSTARVFTLTGDTGRVVYSGSDDGLINQGSPDNTCTIYLRWRRKVSSGGSGTWNDTSVTKNDERLDV